MIRPRSTPPETPMRRLFVPLAAVLFVATTLAAQNRPARDTTRWEVEGTHGSADTVRFETTEGTWINLDASPDGSWIVFDLLGDIYRMPIGGGRAPLFSGGAAFDHPPRERPGARAIVFNRGR